MSAAQLPVDATASASIDREKAYVQAYDETFERAARAHVASRAHPAPV